MSLTDVQCVKKHYRRKKQYRLSDINGLSLRIDPNGKKILVYQIHGKWTKEVQSIRYLS